MTVQEMIDQLSQHPPDMEVVGSSDRHTYPADIYLSTGAYDEAKSEWNDNGKKVVIVEVSH